MATIPQPFLFSWKEIDGASDLDRLRLVLGALPDEALVSFLEQRRGRGRDDYPIRPMWNSVIAGIVSQHPSAAALLRELRRNGELRQLCGFNPFGGEKSAPSDDAMERFLKLIVEHGVILTHMFHQLIDELKKELPDLGVKTAVDSKAIPSFGNPVRDEKKAAESDGRRDTDADWGKKTYKGTRKDGTTWEKVTKWFGYKLHLMVDSVYELPLAFDIDVASSSDMKNLTPHHSRNEENEDAGYPRPGGDARHGARKNTRRPIRQNEVADRAGCSRRLDWQLSSIAAPSSTHAEVRPSTPNSALRDAWNGRRLLRTAEHSRFSTCRDFPPNRRRLKNRYSADRSW